MRFSPEILLSLVALAPAFVSSAPAPQGEAYATVSDSVLIMSTGSAPAAGSPGASASGSCGRGGRGGRNRWGQGRPTGIPVGAASSVGSDSSASDSGSTSADTESSSESFSASSLVEFSTSFEIVTQATSAEVSQSASTDSVNLAASGPPAGNEGQQPQPSGQADSQPSPSAASSSGGGSSSASGPDSSLGTASSGFEADILKAHNDFRAGYNAGTLSWNASAAALAKDYFTQHQCVMAHSLSPGLGENLHGSGNGAKLTAQGAVDGWGAEAANWEKGDGFKLETGHFTQLVWKATTHVGCAHVVCNDMASIIACEYGPPGNAAGGYDANVGK